MKHQLKNHFKNFWPLWGYLIISLVCLSPILLQHGLPFKYDWSWPFYDLKDFLKGIGNLGDAGIAGALGKYGPLLLSLLGFLHLPPELALKLFLLIIHTFSGYGFYLLIKERTNSKLISFFAGIAFAFSPYIFIRTITGFICSLIAYALFPWIVRLYLKEKKGVFDFILLGFLLALSYSQSQAGFLITFYLFTLSVVMAFQGKFKKEFGNFLLTIALFFIFSLPWVMLLFKNHGQNLIATGTEVSTLKYIANLPHSLRNTLMLSDHIITRDFFYPFARTAVLIFSFAAIYLIAAFSLLDKKNRALVFTSILTTLAVLPFSIGPTGVFSRFYSFVYNHFSYIAFFRETYHFEFLLSFALIFLFALGVAQIFHWFPAGRPGSIILRSVAILPVLIIIAPYFTFDYAGYFHLQPIPDEYRQTNEFFKANKQFCTKVYYPPSLGFIYFKDDLTPDAVNSDLIASAFGVPYLTDGSSVLNTASDEMFFRNELTSQFLEREDNGEVAALMGEGGTDCLIVRSDIATKFYQASNLWRETDLAVRGKWLNQDMLSLAEGKKGLYLDRQFGDKIYIFKIDQNAKIKDQNDNLKFKIDNTIISAPGRDLASGGQQYNNTTMNFLPLTDWANNYAYYKDGWSRGRYDFWRKLIFAQLRQDFIYTDKPESVLLGKVDFEGDYELLTRYLDGGTAGSFEIKIQDASYKIQKDSGEEKFVVKDLGKISVKKGDKVEIKNVSGENAIADIVLVKITE